MIAKRNKLLLGLGAAAVAAGAVWMVCPRSQMQQRHGAPACTAPAALPRVPTGPSPITLTDRKVPVPLQLLERHTLTHDTDRFRFSLPSPDHIVGLPTGQHVHLQTVLNGKKLVRVYTPVSSDADKGVLDFVIKLYRPNEAFPDGGKMSKVLDALKPGDTMDVRGPTGRFFYQGNGKLGFKTDKWQTEPNKFHDAKKIVMIAGGSGITPMLQLIKHVLSDPTDDTQLELLFANKSVEDIMLRDQLDDLAAKHPKQLKVWYTVDKAPAGWKYSEGFINADMIKDTLSPPAEDTFVFICGPKPMVKHACMPSLGNLGYPKERIHVF